MLNEKENNQNKVLLINSISPEHNQNSNDIIRRGMIDATLCSVFFSMNTIIIKYAKEHNPTNFTSFNFAFWRGLTSTIALYYYIKKEETTFLLFVNIKSAYWLTIRAVGFFVSFITFIISLMYVRVSIAQVISSISPVITLIVAVIVLNEKFHSRYIAGIILCFIGSAIIVLNEKGNNEEIEGDLNSFYIGIGLCLLNVLMNGYFNVSQKVLIDLGMSNKHQVFYVSFSLLCCSTIMCVLTKNFGFQLSIMFCSILNGFFFFCANHYAQESLKVLQVGGCIPFNYLQTIFVFGMCLIILKEPLFLTDIIGSLIIVSFHGYNSWNPIK